MAAKKRKTKRTGSAAATAAARLLRNSKATKAAKSAAGSALSQTGRPGQANGWRVWRARRFGEEDKSARENGCRKRACADAAEEEAAEIFLKRLAHRCWQASRPVCESNPTLRNDIQGDSGSSGQACLG
ncbi:MAG: hypothetical protein FJW20_00305 [Acidimicrobiia bacterium]|nr:hypothetical protein [Acidimicrobiia bacterium]